MDDILITIAV